MRGGGKGLESQLRSLGCFLGNLNLVSIVTIGVPASQSFNQFLAGMPGKA